MARKGEDPMSGLLSNVGGIDSSLFQKPQSLKDLRGQGSPVKTPPDQRQSFRPQQHVRASPASDVRPNLANSLSPAASLRQNQQPAAKPAQTALESNRHLDALLGTGFTKPARPMRDTARSGSAGSQAVEIASSRPSQQRDRATHRPASLAYANQGGLDDLDTVFGVLGGQSQAPAASDPFSLFGGLGTTQQATPASPSHRHSRSLEDSRGEAAPRSQIASPPAPRHRTFLSGGSEDWGGMTAAISGLSSPLSSSVLHEETLASSAQSPSFEGPWESTEPYPSQSTTPDPQRRTIRPEPSSFSEAPPPSYETVTRTRGVSSPRSRLSGHGSGKYRIYRDGEDFEDATSPRHASGPRTHRRSSSSEKAQQKARQQQSHLQQTQPQQEQIRDQAKQWLSAGQKWLSGARQKVAQAVKDTQAQINSKLEELEGRQFDGGNAGSSNRPAPLAAGMAAQSLDDIPAYYFEWAKTIEELPSHEQGKTLAAMPQEDAENIQRILRQNSGRRSLDTAEAQMVAEAQRRSYSDNKPSRLDEGRPSPVSAPPRRSRSSELAPSPAARHVPDRLAQSRSARPQSATTERDGSPQQVPSSPSRKEGKQRIEESSADLMGLNLEAPNRPHRSERQPETGSAEFMGDREKGADGRAEAPTTADHDLLGLSSDGVARPPQSAAQGLDEMFGAHGQAGGKAAFSQDGSPDLQELFGRAPAARQAQQAPRPGKPPDSMIDFGADAVPAGFDGLYQPGLLDEEQEGEPEARKVARKKRLAEMHSRMQKQLEEKLARDKAESQQQVEQHELRAFHRERVEAWKSGKKDNIRALLSSLHTILWENSGWTPPQMTDLVDVSRVKRSYMKANLVVHPDKVKQKGGTVEQIVVADMAFDTLKVAWAKFEATELRR